MGILGMVLPLALLYLVYRVGDPFCRYTASCIRGRNQTASAGSRFFQMVAHACAAVGLLSGVYRKRAGHGTAEPSKI